MRARLTAGAVALACVLALWPLHLPAQEGGPLGAPLPGAGVPSAVSDSATPGEVAATAPAPAASSLVRGKASWYGRQFHGRRTASGERFDMHALTAAHKTLPFGSRVRVHNPANGREVVVRINDRGPRARHRVIDLSRAAAAALGILQAGEAMVVLHAH